jgi:hypothetical protein
VSLRLLYLIFTRIVGWLALLALKMTCSGGCRRGWACQALCGY